MVPVPRAYYEFLYPHFNRSGQGLLMALNPRRSHTCAPAHSSQGVVNCVRWRVWMLCRFAAGAVYARDRMLPFPLLPALHRVQVPSAHLLHCIQFGPTHFSPENVGHFWEEGPLRNGRACLVEVLTHPHAVHIQVCAAHSDRR